MDGYTPKNRDLSIWVNAKLMQPSERKNVNCPKQSAFVDDAYPILSLRKKQQLCLRVF
jgi:hypothetical protein